MEPVGLQTAAAAWWGSLSTLPYTLAEAEQNFLVPTQTQALIWGDLAPQMILSAKLPRWWNATPAQLHWVGLHLRYGRELIADAALDPSLREQVSAALGVVARPAHKDVVGRLIREGEVKEALDNVTPSELISLARDVGAQRDPKTSCLLGEIRQLDGQITCASISREFGTPKPTLTNSYQPETSQPSHVPHTHGILQPNYGGELGIEHPLLGRTGGRDQYAAIAAQYADSAMDPEARRAYFRLASGETGRRY